MTDTGCHGCMHCGDVYPDGSQLCDHPAVADHDMDEVGQRPPEADDEQVALGGDIRRWLDSILNYDEPGCPGRETSW